MASACVNNAIGMSADSFSTSSSTYGWLSPRISFSRDDDTAGKVAPAPLTDDASLDTATDFEFRLGEDHADMLPADKLFSDGKLVPLVASTVAKSSQPVATKQISETGFYRRTGAGDLANSSAEVNLFSPKAPTCTSRWKELLGLRKLHSNSSKLNQSNQNPKSLKNLLHRSSRSNVNGAATVPCPTSPPFVESSLNLPLLKDSSIPASDSETITISASRLSLSSSTSHELHEEHPRLSLDSEKSCPGPNPFIRNPNPIRMVRKSLAANPGSDELQSLSGPGGSGRTVSMDSPRMNSSGKIVFQGLERSSSSPSSFNGGGSRIKHRGMERSYSANVRVTPVLNVPVCSLRGSSKPGTVFGFGPLFSSSPHKKELVPGSAKAGCSGRTRVDRI